MKLAALRKVNLREVQWGHYFILLKALLVMASLFYPVWWIHIHLLAGRLPTLPLSLAVSFLGVQILVILLEIMASAVVKKWEAIERRRSTQFRSSVQRALAAHLSRKDRLSELKKLRRRHSADFDWSVAALLATVTGETRERLSALAVSLGVVRRWQRVARRGRQEYKHVLEWMATLAPDVARVALQPVIRDKRQPVQAAAYRALVRCSNPEQTGNLFREVLRAPPLVRTLLGTEFRAYAEHLAAQDLRGIFQSQDETEVVAALEMVESWRRVLPLPELAGLCGHANPEIRGGAIRVAPLAAVRGELAVRVLQALEDPNAAVRIAALTSAARMGLQDALEAAERAVSSPDDALCRQACLTLASFGSKGESALQGLIVAGDRRVGAWAMEALASARIGRGLAQIGAVHA